MTVEVLVRVLTRAVDRDRLHAQVGEDHHRGRAGTARASEHDCFLAGELQSEGLHKYLEAVIIRVVAAQAAVGQARDGVDVAHAPGNIGQLVHIGYEIALVRDGDVHALPLIRTDERLELIGFTLELAVVEPGELSIDDGCVAVTQDASQHAVGTRGVLGHDVLLRAFAEVHEQAEKLLCFIFEPLGCASTHVIDFALLALGVEYRAPRLGLHAGNVLGQCHPHAEKVENLAIDLVDLASQFIEVHRYLPRLSVECRLR